MNKIQYFVMLYMFGLMLLSSVAMLRLERRVNKVEGKRK